MRCSTPPLAALTAAAILTGCSATVPSDALPPLREWSCDEQRLLSNELRALPESSVVVEVVIDYANLRGQIRAARGSPTPRACK